MKFIWEYQIIPQKIDFQKKKLALMRFELGIFGLLSQSANRYATKTLLIFRKKNFGCVHPVRYIHWRENSKIQIDLACHNSNSNTVFPCIVSAEISFS